MEVAWYDIVGFLGVLLVLGAYLLLQLERLRADTLEYSFMNGFGAAFILVSLAKDFNFSAFAIEAAWLAISIWGVILYFSRTKDTKLKEKNHGS